MKKYCITDIHGCLKTFKSLLEKIEFSLNDELYLLGDYIDRGPDSKGVIDYIWQLQKEGYAVNCLKGNHESQLLKSIGNKDDEAAWLYWGGKQTLRSFSVQSVDLIDEKYLQWFDSLAYSFEVDEYILVHAGLNFEIENPLEDNYAMMWARGYYESINYKWLGERVIIHGHTPLTKSVIEEQFANLSNNKYFDIDNGCVYKRDGLGSLCCFELKERKMTWQSFCS